MDFALLSGHGKLSEWRARGCLDDSGRGLGGDELPTPPQQRQREN